MREWVVPAVGVALSPLPVLGMLLVLGGRRPVVHGAAYWAAWTIGVAGPTIAFVALAARSEAVDDGHTAIALAEIVVGVAFLAIAARLAISGRLERSEVAPAWLEALDRSGPRRTAALAVILSAGNPKILALILAAAVALARDGQSAWGAAGFVILAASMISLLLAGYIAFPHRSRLALVRLRVAIARNDRLIVIVVGLLVGTYFVVDGIRSD